MSNYIKLTNARPEFQAQCIILRKDAIVSVFQGQVEREDQEPSTVTMVYAPPHGTWEVAESPDEILEMLEL